MSNYSAHDVTRLDRVERVLDFALAGALLLVGLAATASPTPDQPAHTVTWRTATDAEVRQHDRDRLAEELNRQRGTR